MKFNMGHLQPSTAAAAAAAGGSARARARARARFETASPFNLHRMDLFSILQSESPAPLRQPPGGVYYLPTAVTTVQRDLQEIMIEIFRLELAALFAAHNHKNSIRSLLSDDAPRPDAGAGGSAGGYSSVDKVNLLFEQLRLIDRHPSLLVDHFIPRKLILLDTSERMLNVSGKLQLFDRVVDSLIEPPRPYGLLVVAPSVKELEMIEGVIIGKEVVYRNLSSSKLYDDRRPWPAPEELRNEDARDEAPRKRRRARRARRAAAAPTPLCIYLITTQQLYSYSLSHDVDLIVSFDVSLDCDSPGLELIRTTCARGLLAGPTIKPPIIIPVPALSIEHCVLGMLPPPQVAPTPKLDNPLTQWKLEAINTFVVNRHQLHAGDDHEFYVSRYGHNMSRLRRWFREWDQVSMPLSFDLDELVGARLEPVRQQYWKELQRNFLYSFGPLPDRTPPTVKHEGEVRRMDYNSFKRTFTQVLIERVAEIDATIAQKYTPALEQLRKAETHTQGIIDEDTLKIGAVYRELQRANEQAAASERQLARADAEHHKASERQRLAAERLQHLQQARPSNELINNQFGAIDELRARLALLNAELERLGHEDADTRADYQRVLAEAAQAAAQLKQVQDAGARLTAKLNGPGSTVLPALARKDDIISYEYELGRLQRENALMEAILTERLHQMVKERESIMESTGGGSSSRGVRLSRATTPF